jgi:hypothetical protein
MPAEELKNDPGGNPKDPGPGPFIPPPDTAPNLAGLLDSRTIVPGGNALPAKSYQDELENKTQEAWYFSWAGLGIYALGILFIFTCKLAFGKWEAEGLGWHVTNVGAPIFFWVIAFVVMYGHRLVVHAVSAADLQGRGSKFTLTAEIPTNQLLSAPVILGVFGITAALVLYITSWQMSGKVPDSLIAPGALILAIVTVCAAGAGKLGMRGVGSQVDNLTSAMEVPVEACGPEFWAEVDKKGKEVRKAAIMQSAAIFAAAVLMIVLGIAFPEAKWSAAGGGFTISDASPGAVSMVLFIFWLLTTRRPRGVTRPVPPVPAVPA